jgi:hypothetical protein
MLAQAHVWSSPVLIVELDTGRLQRAANGQIVCGGHRGLCLHEFGTTDGGDADRGFAGQILSTPAIDAKLGRLVAGLFLLVIALDLLLLLHDGLIGPARARMGHRAVRVIIS